MKKPPYKTISVTLDTGKTVQVGRTSGSNFQRLLSLQESLLQAYVDSDGAVGPLMHREDIIDQLTEICSILPIVGPEEKFLDYNDICDNWEQLILLFFNGGLDADTRELKSILTPSYISNLHFLPYNEQLKKMVERKMKEQEEENS